MPITPFLAGLPVLVCSFLDAGEYGQHADRHDVAREARRQPVLVVRQRWCSAFAPRWPFRAVLVWLDSGLVPLLLVVRAAPASWEGTRCGRGRVWADLCWPSTGW